MRVWIMERACIVGTFSEICKLEGGRCNLWVIFRDLMQGVWVWVWGSMMTHVE